YEPQIPVRPFAVFANPFSNGAGRDMSPEDLVRYTFAAIESWAAEREMGRHRDETPLEFTSRLGTELPEMQDHLDDLADWYARIAYAGFPLSENLRPGLTALWERLGTATVASPGAP